MAEFSAPVVRIAAIKSISNADAIDLAVVGGYRSIIKKGQFSAGDLAAYIPKAVQQL